MVRLEDVSLKLGQEELLIEHVQVVPILPFCPPVQPLSPSP
jgi:hypothetical protein